LLLSFESAFFSCCFKLFVTDRPLLIEPPSFPEPAVSMAIEPKWGTESQRLATQLQLLSK
jgi:translation elongation factor EF-G